ncbi:hypothetical protein GGX14DRAFT_652005 [Mycena pura]|uniref:Uncharacterized protein n=1 Tax=Mycena pura TaxID=153505 RepID=A0AAD6YBB9_9AGAR|nr:hypothetical protein GGX14DRAFT_652005 [Mycena pura]
MFWYRDPNVVIKNLLDNLDFTGVFDTAPCVEFNAEGKRRWSHFMPANFNMTPCAFDRLNSNKIWAEDQALCDRKYDNDAEFRTFNLKIQLSHVLLAVILSTLKQAAAPNEAAVKRLSKRH